MKTLIQAAATLIVVAVLACNPAKQVAKQDADINSLKAKIIGDWVKSNPCPPPPIINLDSICALFYKVDEQSSSIIHDTIISGSVENENWSAKKITDFWSPQSYKPDTVHILQYVTDTRAIKLLQDSITALRLQVASGSSYQSLLNDARNEKTLWMILFFIAVALAFILTIMWTYSYLKPKL